MYPVRHSLTSWGSLPHLFCLVSLPSARVINRALRPYTSVVHPAKLDKFRYNRNGSLRVTDFITQYDEAKQIREVDLLKPATTTMEEGTRVHNILESHMATYELSSLLGTELWDDLLSVIKRSGEHSEIDILAMSQNFTRLMECTTKLLALARGDVSKPDGAIREVYLRAIVPGDAHDRLIRGIVDGIYLSPDGIVITETKTTRQPEISATAIRLAYHQVVTYYWMLDKLLSAKNPAEYLVSMFSLGEDITRLIIESKWLSKNVTDAIYQLNGYGLAPNIRLEFLKQRRRGVYDIEVFEIPYDRRVCEAVIQSRVDLLDGKRQPYIFRQCDIPQDVHITDDPVDWRSLTESEFYGLNLHIIDHMR